MTSIDWLIKNDHMFDVMVTCGTAMMYIQQNHKHSKSKLGKACLLTSLHHAYVSSVPSDQRDELFMPELLKVVSTHLPADFLPFVSPAVRLHMYCVSPHRHSNDLVVLLGRIRDMCVMIEKARDIIQKRRV